VLLVVETGVATQRIVVHLVAETLFLGQFQHTFEHLTDVESDLSVAGVLGPDGDAIVALANAHHRAADLVWMRVGAEGLTHHRQQGPQPTLVQVGVTILGGLREQPLAALGVGRVLPLGLDALLEQMVVAARRQLAGGHHVVLQSPKVLHCVEGHDALQVVTPARLRGLASRVVVPEHPAILQRVLDGEIAGIRREGAFTDGLLGR
jgi:hypothetical protein